MLKGHPKGLFVFLFANMGERFGYYTMMAIFILFMQAKFGLDAKAAGAVYGTFLFGIYFIPLLGGIIADKFLGFGKTITLGIILMIGGYFMLSQPGSGLHFVYLSLGVVSIGTGFFKGNLQALVGKLYDDAKYTKFRDSAFNIFYMGINIGAFFAPSAAQAMSNYILGKGGLTYNANIPSMAHEFLKASADGQTYEKADELTKLANEAIVQGGGYQFTNLTDFSNYYIDILSQSYSYGFGIAAISIFVSLIIFLVFRKTYKHVDVMHKHAKQQENHNIIELTPKQSNKRLRALALLFIVNIFFWMAFHQNGFTLTIFARDYTFTEVNSFTYILFDLNALLPIIAAIIGVILLIGKKTSGLWKGVGVVLVIVGGGLAYYTISSFNSTMPITPMIFQHFNPIFIVFLTPIIIGIFAALNKRGKEPSAPRKIGIGLFLAAASFLLMVLVSAGLVSPRDFIPGALADSMRVTPYWLIATYFSLTISELFYSPIGISFVSKVAPPQYAGLMQGGWLGSTAIGNMLAGLIGPFWEQWEMWQFFLLLVGMLLISAVFIFSIMKTLESATED
ncbi:MAG: MFS transporter [Bacteroidetes bacterium]|nr:MAG: MFS transporter [Bacteroidota bacterium]